MVITELFKLSYDEENNAYNYEVGGKLKVEELIMISTFCLEKFSSISDIDYNDILDDLKKDDTSF